MSNPISSSNAAAPVAAYSQAVEAGDLVFVSGQIPLNPETGELVAETIETATAQSLRKFLAGHDALLQALIAREHVRVY